MKIFLNRILTKQIKRLLVILKYLYFLITFITFIILNKSVYSDTMILKEGENLYIEKKYDKAKNYFKKLVEYGNSSAETMTGIMYLKGQGYKSNASIAAIWFYKASLKGNKNAQLILGTQYLYGYGVEKNLEKAYTWLDLSSKSKNIIVSNQALKFIKIIESSIKENEIKIFKNQKKKITIKNHDFK